MRVVHQGRGGYIEVDGRRYVIEHVAAGRFAIHFPSGHRHRDRDRDRQALAALVAREPDTWALEDRSRRRAR